MKFEYEELEDGNWLVTYEDLDLKVFASSKDRGTEVMLMAIERVCHNMLAFYGRILGEAEDAQEVRDAIRGAELH